MRNHHEVMMEKMMRAHVLFALAATIAGSGAIGCVGSGGNAGGIDGGGSGGMGGTFGGVGGIGGIGGSGGCFECLPGCFDCGFGCSCGTSGTSGSGGSDNDGGVITREWIPPFANLGDDGTWRSTASNTLCMGGGNLDALGVWSDQRGVYVRGAGTFAAGLFLGNANGNPAAPPFDAGFAGAGAGFGGVGGGGGGGGFGGFGGTGGTVSEECPFGSFHCNGSAIYFNDGQSGWRPQHAVSSFQSVAGTRFSGVPLRELVVHNTDMFATDCTLLMIDGNTERCDHSASGVSTFSAVDEQLAYATIGPNLLVFDGALWSVHPTPIPFSPTALWANATDVVAVGDLGRIARLRDGTWTNDNRTIELLTAVWGGDGDELFVGTANGEILHRDASGTWVESMRLRGVTCNRPEAIVGIWGAEGTLYFHSEHVIARWDGTEFEEIGNWACALPDPNFGTLTVAMRSIWGNGPNELFIALSDFTRSADPSFDQCGNGFVMYFDGTSFHRL